MNRIWLIIVVLVLTSCGSRINNSVFYAPEEGMVALSGRVMASDGRSSYGEDYKRKKPQQLEIQKKGHKTKYQIWHGTKPNVWAFAEMIVQPLVVYMYLNQVEGGEGPGVAALAGSTSLIGVVDLAQTPKMVPDEKMHFELEPLPAFDTVKSTLSVQRLYLDTNNIGTTNYWYKSRRSFRSNVPYDTSDYNYFNAFSEGWALEKMNDFCEYVGLYDTAELNLSSYQDLSVYATLTDYKVYYINLDRDDIGKFMTLSVDYSVKDRCGNEVFRKTIESSSGEFMLMYSNNYLFNDAIDYSMMALLKEPEVNKMIVQQSSCTKQVGVGSPSKTLSTLDYDQLQESCFRLETRFGAGIGIPVGQDGLVAVSHSAFDVIEDTLALQPIGVGKKYMAEMVEESMMQDYVLLKIDTTFEEVFSVAGFSQYKMNRKQNLSAIGFTEMLEAFSVAKGWVGAFRQEHDYPLVQLDIDANTMYFPAVFNERGQLLGFVNASLKSASVEGISFMRPITD